MRPDMAKVIVERPRRGGWKLGKGSGRPAFDAPSMAGMRRPHADRKGLNENLAPLIRFLRSRVGKHWSKVYSEISGHLRADNAVQQHVRDHLDDFIAVRTSLLDGDIVIHDQGRWGGPRPLKESFCRFYVHPVSGVIHANRFRDARVRRWKSPQETASAIEARRIDIGPMRQLHKLKGLWFEVELAKTEPAAARNRDTPPERDAIRDAGLTTLPLPELYGAKGVRGVKKRQLGRKELLAYGLHNDDPA